MEKWVDIKGYEDYYSISNKGNILSKRKNKILSPGNNGRDYLFVYLWKNNKPKRFYVHRLVAVNFIENKHKKSQVNHIDCNKLNNSAFNLEWTTPEENISHAVKNKRFYTSEYQKKQTSLGSRGEKSHFCKLKEEDVILIKKDLSLNIYTQQEIALKYNTTRGSIGAIKRGVSWKHV